MEQNNTNKANFLHNCKIVSGIFSQTLRLILDLNTTTNKYQPNMNKKMFCPTLFPYVSHSHSTDENMFPMLTLKC